VQDIIDAMKQRALNFPVIGKPDIGMQGKSVKKLHSERELENYVLACRVNFLIQEFIPYENEVGIFYYRFPNEKNGHISGIVQKQFLTVEGDGQSTMTELLRNNKRFVLQIPTLARTFGSELNEILKNNEKRVLVPYGNHARGAQFIDASHLISDQLIQTVDSVCKQVRHFYFGRLDIRFNTYEELLAGKNFSIIELNGAGSEPTHMYDPRHSIFFAWREIIRHWTILWKISRINHCEAQLPYMKMSSGLQMFRRNREYVKILSNDLRKTA
jgi:hypothetical protein